MVKKIILDCDPGHDDAIAMLLAHGNPDIELLAVTTVVGNQMLEKVTRNALAVARVINLTGVPFAAGATRSPARQIEVAAETHRESGLDGSALPEAANTLESVPALDLIIDLILSPPPKTISLVPTGGLLHHTIALG